ncbi:hypothetical protein PLICBS_008054 [Purpureocillium lilacinum]|uniref:uncharacterized protein n=1 Tax=Purpureocillium lilacinum TaxID=33203 RepID=UPI00208A4C2D|nr:hypothetical protein PLICBS_008054 [Purpureocillium lilacinum]
MARKTLRESAADLLCKLEDDSCDEAYEGLSETSKISYSNISNCAKLATKLAVTDCARKADKINV